MKRTKKSVMAMEPPWHPDFRDVAVLPDIKVVRTDFFVKAVLLLAWSALLFFAGSTEFKLASLRAGLADKEALLEAGAAANRQNLAMSGNFTRENRKLEEWLNYMQRPILASEYLIEIGGIHPELFTLTEISFRSEGGLIQGRVQGSPDQASTLVSEYRQLLETSESIGRQFERIQLTSMVQDTVREGMVFRIEMSSPTQRK